MDYRVDPTPLGPRSGSSLLVFAAAAVIGLGIVLLAHAAERRPGPDVASDGSPARVGGVDATRPVGSGTGGDVAPAPDPGGSIAGRLPSNSQLRIYCHALPARRCSEIAGVALGAVVDPTLPPPATIDVWSSLLCGTVFDCPPERLAGRSPAGSAVIEFTKAIVIWVNVSDTADGSLGPGLDAWVIRPGPAG